MTEDEEFGGKGLQRRRQYRDDEARVDRYDLVFDHDGDLNQEKERKRRKEEDTRDVSERRERSYDKNRRSDGRDYRDDRRRIDRDDRDYSRRGGKERDRK
jgi:hypothetical protein